MKILVVGDSYIRADQFKTAFATLAGSHQIEYLDIAVDPMFSPRDESERRLREFEGNPDQVAAALTDHDVLVVHGAPVSLSVLDASPRLRLVCCARGGPVNVDIAEATKRGITVANTPGKNASAVADLTLALMLMLARGFAAAQGYLRRGNKLGGTFDGAQFFGSELSGLRLGLVGLGKVGMEVCARARGFGMAVSAFDPYVSAAVVEDAGAAAMSLPELVAGCDVLSLHARLTPETERMVDSKLLAAFGRGGYLVNTAREGLVDEHAVMAALRSGQLKGVAVDVFEHDGPLARAIVADDERVVALPHIGGATHETVDRAMRMLIARIEEFDAMTDAYVDVRRT